MTDKNKNLDDLEAFLISNKEQSKADTISELRAAGIDTSKFLARVKDTVQRAYAEQLRVIADDERRRQLQARPDFLRQVANMSREAMLAMFGQLQQGRFGADYREAALAHCRNKDASSLSDQELRTWLEDLGDILGEPSDEC